MEKCMVGIYLGICSITDIKKKEVSVPLTIGVAALGVLLQCLYTELSWLMWFGGIMIGVCLTGVSRITAEALGYGDCFCVMALGACLGAARNIELLLGGLTLAAVFSAIMLAAGKANKKDKLPFLPFLFAAHIGISLLEWGAQI